MNSSTRNIGEQTNVQTNPAEGKFYWLAASYDLDNSTLPEVIIEIFTTEDMEDDEPSEEDISRVMVAPMENENPNDRRFRQITEITRFNMAVIVDFAKMVPGFCMLPINDQISLIMPSLSEIMLLKIAREYDYETDSIIFTNNQPHSCSSYTPAGIGNIIDDLLYFGRLMYSLKLDNTEYALLKALVILSERPNVTNRKTLMRLRVRHMVALKVYTESRRPRDNETYEKLLSMITDLHTFGNHNSDICSSLKLKEHKMTPGAVDVWDVIIFHYRFLFNIRSRYQRSPL